MSSEIFTNRLAKEKSPYLLQHAHNPVDWFPWGKEAFEKAKSEKKPIFLSIGYSTCHWCHVMEEESFVNTEIANILNKDFVSIKVDREERPDVDHIYMQAVMAMTGGGGWPMSMFLTPDLKPFYGGTYFPPTERWGRPGFPTILNAITEKWRNERKRLLKAGNEFVQYIKEESEKHSKETHSLDEGILQSAFQQFEARFDSERGGFSEAPKFPQSHTLSFLLRHGKRFKVQNAFQMVEKTLDEMAKGGMYDQLGGGFHRYSTDAEWRVPHFEKMLYDQAILAKSYLEAYQATKNESYAQTAREILDYVLRDMTGPEGGFYSAEDADSLERANSKHKKEGAFYVWSHDEIKSVLGKEKTEIINYYFGISIEGNAIHDPQNEFTNKNILHIAHSLEETASQFKKSIPEIQKIINESKSILLKERGKRPRPHLDDKVLTDWNGLMISSFALASRVLKEERYQKAAKRAADFLLNQMKGKNNRLMHRFRDGEVSINGFLEDYAFFIHGLIDLYEATFDPHYLGQAQFFATEMIGLFWDQERGGFYLTSNDSEELISRIKEFHDGAIPSGNSIAVLSLLRLSRLTMNQEFEEKARETMEACSVPLARYASGFAQMLIALDFALGPTKEIVISSKENDPDLPETIQTIFEFFLPNKVVLFHPMSSANTETIEQLSPFIKSQTPVNGKMTIYVCQNYNCQLPIQDTSQLSSLLAQ